MALPGVASLGVGVGADGFAPGTIAGSGGGGMCRSRTMATRLRLSVPSPTLTTSTGSSKFRSTCCRFPVLRRDKRSEEHPSELQSLMGTSYAVFCLKKKKYSLQLTHA